MFDNLNLRNKFIVAVAVPVNVLVGLAVWLGAVVGEPVAAAVSGAAAVATLVVARTMGVGAGRRVGAVAAKLEAIDADPAGADEAVNDTASDEIGDLDRGATAAARRIDQAVTAERSSADRRISAVLGEFAQRVHHLADEQIDLVDWLEATEEDADRLGTLFELDHLANRLRRISETAMVLAECSPGHRRDEPATVADVIRVAIGESPEYGKVVIRSMDEVLIRPEAACGMTHLLSELVSNATGVSPEGSPAELHGVHVDDGSYRVTVIDAGPGLGEGALDEARQVIAAPEDFAPGPEDHVGFGFAVIGRLARALDAAVELSPGAGAGLAIEVTFPAAIVAPAPDGEVGSPREAGRGARSARPNRRPAAQPDGGLGEWTAPEVQPAAAPLSSRSEAVAEEASPASSPPASEADDDRGDGHDDGHDDDGDEREHDEEASPNVGAPSGSLSEALGTEVDFDADVADLLDQADRDEPAAAPSADEPSDAGPDTDDEPADDPTDEGEWAAPQVAARASAEALGLTRRRRGPKTAPSSDGPRARASSRKPDEVRSMITKYRDGLKGQRRAEGVGATAGVTADADEDADAD